jgi:hypothetical protein
MTDAVRAGEPVVSRSAADEVVRVARTSNEWDARSDLSVLARLRGFASVRSLRAAGPS